MAQYQLDCVQIGPISSATMEPEHLIPTFMSKLDDIKDEISCMGSSQESVSAWQERVEDITKIDNLLSSLEQRRLKMGEEVYYESEESDWDLDTLFNMLDEFSPDGCWFGSHEGDGACYGWWEYDSEDEDEFGDDEEDMNHDEE